MHSLLKDILAVGFDLDGTLYNSTPEINDRVRNKIAEYILKKMPELQNIPGARHYFERRYINLKSGSMVLEEAGYKDSLNLMNRCLADANILDLMAPNLKLCNILNEMSSRYKLYLITSGFKNESVGKLNRIGIDTKIFSYELYGDDPGHDSKSDGKIFKEIISETNLPAEKHVYVGDRLKQDILPPKKIGMKTIAVWSEIPEADISIKNINEIGDLLL